jgi:hypothetical protein
MSWMMESHLEVAVLIISLAPAPSGEVAAAERNLYFYLPDKAVN